jgi:hypothetical protein
LVIGVLAAIVLGLVAVAVVAGLIIGVIVRTVGEGGGVSLRTEHPTSVEELQDSYELESGALELNLGDLELPEGTTGIRARGDVGVLTVVVPRGVAVRVEAEAGNGAVTIFDRAVSGEDVERNFEEEGYGQADRRLSLELAMDTGVISVVREG